MHNGGHTVVAKPRSGQQKPVGGNAGDSTGWKDAVITKEVESKGGCTRQKGSTAPCAVCRFVYYAHAPRYLRSCDGESAGVQRTAVGRRKATHLRCAMGSRLGTSTRSIR
jgi:hypothetical protein